MAFRHLGDFIGRYLGIGGATGDAANPLSVRGPGSLHDGGAGGHQIRINKAATGDTASFLFQTGFSGRAEFGTVGSDSFGLKVSTDGSAFTDVFSVNGTGTATFQHDTLFVDGVGIGGASPDSTNRLSVNTEAALFNNAGSDIRLTMNKAAVGDDAALTYQDGFSTRALLGLLGNDDWTLKVSPDGSTFHDAFVVDKDSGTVDFPAGVTGVAADDFGQGDVINTSYMASKGVDLVTNGTGMLGNTYNMPGVFVFDPQVTPDLPATFRYTGHTPGVVNTTEFIAVNPHTCYRISSFVRQIGHAHLQYYGLLSTDLDGHTIKADDHIIVWDGGVSSKTTLAAPLTPGDTTISVVDASGWNNTNPSRWRRNITIFEYRNSAGFTYEFYSRIWQRELFNAGGVNKTTNVISLNQGWPSALQNPDDPNGIWPVGTRIANGASGSSYKYAGYSALRVPILGAWYSTKGWIGGVDRSGLNNINNFAPGTAFVRLLWLPSLSNRPGGNGGFPDSGNTAPVWFGGVSMVPEYTAKLTRAADGQVNIVVPEVNAAGNGWNFVGPNSQIAEV